MIIREVLEAEKEQFNKAANHPLQSWEWGEFRKKTGNQVVRLGEFAGNTISKSYQLTVHPIPKIDKTIMVMTRGPVPNREMLEAISKYGNEKRAICVKVEPNLTLKVGENQRAGFEELNNLMAEAGAVVSRPQFAKYTYMLDLTKSEDELLAGMHQKTRYNIKLAQKHGVTVEEDNSEDAWETYWKLTVSTTARQRFYSHDRKYHRTLWETLLPTGMIHLLRAKYQDKTLSTWILFSFDKVLYYPYGAWSGENREVMANNLMVWEAIRFGKNKGLNSFDMWGAAGPDTPKDDPWWGFTNFKEGYGGALTEFVGCYDLILDKPTYALYQIADKWRWKFLRLKKNFPIRIV